MKHIRLRQDDWTLLMLTIGYACGAAMNNREPELAQRFLDLLHRISKGSSADCEGPLAERKS